MVAYTDFKVESLVSTLKTDSSLLGGSLRAKALSYANSIEGLHALVKLQRSGAHWETLTDRIRESGLDIGVKDSDNYKTVVAKLEGAFKATVEAAQSSEALKTINKYKGAAAAEAKKIAGEAEKEGGFFTKHFGGRIGKAFTKHEEWMKTKSPGARMGFAVGEMVLGSIATEIGGQMLSQAITGLKQSSLQQVDDKGGRTTVLVMAPLSPGDRTFKAVVGTGTAAAGLVATGLGFYGIFRSHEM